MMQAPVDRAVEYSREDVTGTTHKIIYHLATAEEVTSERSIMCEFPTVELRILTRVSVTPRCDYSPDKECSPGTFTSLEVSITVRDGRGSRQCVTLLILSVSFLIRIPPGIIKNLARVAASHFCFIDDMNRNIRETIIEVTRESADTRNSDSFHFKQFHENGNCFT
ncbi:hypothetical protein J6590_008440 [Homalodisca vitripennis]|nr:hypothetical protein J6590_008440 [Homalodisca vitripennis]